MKRTEKQKGKQIRKTTKKRFYKKIWFWLLISLVTVSGVGGKIVWNKYGETVKESVNTGYQIADGLDKNSLRSDSPTVIYDAQGQEIKRLNTQADYQIKTEDFNPYLRKGFVATEDERFYQHKGVDLWALIRAGGSFIRGGSLQGGSTITQQLVKNKILKNSEQTVNRKATEMVIAQELEKKFSKEDILTSYLNYIYFGHGANGVGMASKYYFNKDQKDLTIRESAVIIGLTNNPTLYDPVNNPENSDKKVKEILGKMLRNKVISKEQYQTSVNEKTQLNIGTLINEKDYTDNYAVSFAMRQAAEDLAVADGFKLQYKFETEDDYNTYHQTYNSIIQEKMEQLVAGGYKIYTSINLETQRQLEEQVYQELSKYQDVNPETGKFDLQTSVTVLDNKTHNIVAVIGGRGTEGDYLNRSYQSYRQPGSSAKPIIAYTPAFETGNLLPQSVLMDSQVPEFPTVGNASGTYSNSAYTVREGVNWSLNTIALRASLLTDINNVTNKLAAMEFHNLHPFDNNNIISIGGFTYGVTTTEMAGAYSALTNQGVYYTPSSVTKITSAYDDATLYQNTYTGKKVYSKEASYAMLDVLKTSGNGHTLYDARALATNYPVEFQGGKTGTTDEYKDVYFASVNSYYTTTVWVGADQARTLSESERTEAKILNRIVTETVLVGKAPVDFEKPSTVIKNGNNISFTSQESVNDFESVNSSKFSSRAKKLNQDSQERNKNRLTGLDYRIIYGLTEEEELAREGAVEKLIGEFNINEFETTLNYESFQKKLADIQAKLADVKRNSKKKEYQSKLQELRTQVSEQYSYLLNVQKQRENVELQHKIESAKQNSKSSNSEKIAELQSSLIQIKNRLQSAIEAGADYSGIITEMDGVITQLNRLGEQTPYYRVYSDGKQTIFVETEKPTLTSN